jgi:hypothetical protein
MPFRLSVNFKHYWIPFRKTFLASLSPESSPCTLLPSPHSIPVHFSGLISIFMCLSYCPGSNLPSQQIRIGEDCSSWSGVRGSSTRLLPQYSCSCWSGVRGSSTRLFLSLYLLLLVRGQGFQYTPPSSIFLLLLVRS